MMYKAILSLCLLHVEQGLSSEEQLNHFQKLSRVIYILSNYYDVKFESYKKFLMKAIKWICLFIATLL